MNAVPRTARLGAALYVLWGVLHVGAAVQVTALGLSIEPSAVQGRVLQNAWHLVILALFAIVVGVRQYRTNARLARRANGVVVALTDIGFVVLVLLPGHVPAVPGVVGPIVWVAALALTAIGARGDRPGANASA